jgi:hypothetical protein
VVVGRVVGLLGGRLGLWSTQLEAHTSKAERLTDRTPPTRPRTPLVRQGEEATDNHSRNWVFNQFCNPAAL